jgi:hypothetical protein
VFGPVRPDLWDKFALEVVENALKPLAGAIQVFETQADRNKFILLMGGIGSVGIASYLNVPGKVKFPADKVGEIESVGPTSTVSSCDPKATADEESVSRFLVGRQWC